VTGHTTPSETDAGDNVGAELLDRLRGVLDRYVVLPTTEAGDAVALWIAATHVQPAWAHAPRLVIRAPEKRCGKSRLLDVVEGTCHRPLITVNASPAAVYRSLGTDDPPTLLIDEADTIFGAKAEGANEDLRGLLNAGHQRNRPTIRYDASRNRVESIPTFAMAALAGIGAMPDTIEDRAVVIRMRRRAPGEVVAPYRARRDGPRLRDVALALHEWLRAYTGPLEAAEPGMPVEDRAADTWEPLIAVADLAGRDWPERARHACSVLTADHDAVTDVPVRVRLLIDCRTAFGDDLALPTVVLLQRLAADVEAPWATFGKRGDGLSPITLGALLREYDIRSANIRFADGMQAKGYSRNDFVDAWERYCPPVDGSSGDDVEGEPSRSSHTSQPRSARDGSPPWDGSTRPTTSTRPGLTSSATTGTDGTAHPHSPICIRCRTPLALDDGTHTHPNCA
jgi:hypothetical protein